MPNNNHDPDLQIRYQIYQFFADQCRPPTTNEIAERLDMSPENVDAAFHRLHDRHMIFLDATTGQIRMANPFSAIPTSYRVRAGEKVWWANCAWDTLGIAAALNLDVDIEANLPTDGQPVTLKVTNGAVTEPDWLIYFPLPCRQWYDDLVYT
ncbi:MAG: hypothetical protein KA314_08010 [Chloroflexi bacterium]|nr:hypothetical protein [Chloroflexota bacterium]MBP8055774.1 hypothetical protein [Chloroflexota bacterium]